MRISAATSTASIVLASNSPARLSLLERAGLTPRVIPSDINELDFIGSSASELTRKLAVAKASKVAAQLKSEIVIGCDSVLEVDGRILGKPKTERRAIEFLETVSGKSGRLVTGHCVIDASTAAEVSAVATTTVHFCDITLREIGAYVATGEPLNVAGAFTIDGIGGWFVDSIDGDHGNVLGLSLPVLRRLLKELGVDWLPLVKTRRQNIHP